jgi:nucleotide-binding universal stress UspA family protein
MTIFPTRILFATDAATLANETGSELQVVHVGTEEYPPYDAYQSLAREVLDGQIRRIEHLGGAVARGQLRMGRAADEVVELAEEIEAGLIVMGGRGRGGLRRALMGSVSDAVVRHAHCPVIVVRGKPVVFPAKILLAADGSREAELAASTTADLAKSTASELHVVTVALGYPYVYDYYDVRHPAEVERELQEARKILDRQVDRLLEAGGTVAQAHLGRGVPDEEIVVMTEELGADLVVLGSKGLGGLRRALTGSVSDSVVRHAHCPVLVVRERRGEAG